jgi:hypothetical protein
MAATRSSRLSAATPRSDWTERRNASRWGFPEDGAVGPTGSVSPGAGPVRGLKGCLCPWSKPAKPDFCGESLAFLNSTGPAGGRSSAVTGGKAAGGRRRGGSPGASVRLGLPWAVRSEPGRRRPDAGSARRDTSRRGELDGGGVGEGAGWGSPGVFGADRLPAGEVSTRAIGSGRAGIPSAGGRCGAGSGWSTGGVVWVWTALPCVVPAAVPAPGSAIPSGVPFPAGTGAAVGSVSDRTPADVCCSTAGPSITPRDRWGLAGGAAGRRRGWIAGDEAPGRGAWAGVVNGVRSEVVSEGGIDMAGGAGVEVVRSSSVRTCADRR